VRRGQSLENNIVIDVKEVEYKDMDWIWVVEDRVQHLSFIFDEIQFSMKIKFLDQLSNH
jgi:hypothetical protein